MGDAWDIIGPSAKAGLDKDLDKVLQLVAPSITHLQWIELTTKVIREDEETDYEYYGNYTSYAYQMVTVRDLFDKLVEMGLIENTPGES